MTSPFEQFRQWVTGGLGVGDPALSDAQIEAYTDAVLSSIATTYDTDPVNLPAEAEPRFNGAELPSIQDVLFYLSDSNLLIPDPAGGWYQSPLLHIIKKYDPDLDIVSYDCYVGY